MREERVQGYGSHPVYLAVGTSKICARRTKESDSCGHYAPPQPAELRAVASLSNVELITALISCNRQLGLVGVQLRILNGVVSLLTTEAHNKALAQYLIQQSGAIGSLDLTTATLEVLACIAFKATRNLFGVRPLLAGRLCTATFAGFTRANASRTLKDPGLQIMFGARRKWLRFWKTGRLLTRR